GSDDDKAKIADFVAIVKQYTDPQELTPELLHALVDKVIVGAKKPDGTQDIEIVWRFVGQIG
ncbi:MAG: DUF4368 domain-containing protein, partial [Clostridia bacterium]|nr:DUF4368 domain-containing protein [Clostridia bacterium]